MIAKYNAQYRQAVVDMMKDFYHSEAVLKSVPEQYFDNTLNRVESNSPFVSLYVIDDGQGAVGYGLLSHTYSNEVGGDVVWIEELYIDASHRGKGLGAQFLDFVSAQYAHSARIRLEVEPANEGATKLYVKKGYSALPYQQYVKDNCQ